MENFFSTTEQSFIDTTTDQKDHCVDKHDLCKFWSSIGECDSNKDWMTQNCAISCDRCNGK